jgi:hypothetical protein
VPHFAIDVVRTRDGIDKLEVYRKLGVREVRVWEGETLTFHVLRGESYVGVERSEVVPGLDPDLVARCMGAESQTAAVKMLRAGVRAASGRGRKGRKRGH